MKISSAINSLAAFIRGLGTTTAPAAGEGILGVSIEDVNGRPGMRAEYDAKYAIQSGLPIGGFNDGIFRFLRMDRSGASASASLIPLFHESFDGNALNTLRWTPTNVTYAPTFSTLGYNFNPAASLSANASAIIVSVPKFLKLQRAPLYKKWRARWAKTANAQAEFGFGIATGSAVPANGVFWRLVGGQAIGVISINSTEYTSVPIDISVIVDPLNYYVYDIFIDDDQATFFIHDTNNNVISNTIVRLQNVQNRMFGQSHLPIFSRLFTGATIPLVAPGFFISDVFLGTSDNGSSRPYDDFLTNIGYGVYANPLTGVQALQYANSAEPANATLSNTAAGYATLGGKYQFVAPAGAVTDYLLFAVQVVDPTELKLKGIRITSKTIGAAGSATIATELEWFLVTNMASASLVSAGTIRIPLGLQTFPINAAIGSLASDVIVDLNNMSVRCNAGRFIGIGIRVPGGAATAAQVIKGTVTPIGTTE